MALKQNLGTLTRSRDLRSFWEHEAGDFTPWLQDHIGLLSEALGLDIEIEGREGEIGGFSVDLYGKEAGTGRTVIIENQLEQSNHDHLGKLLTYAGGRDAGVIVWVAPTIRVEHVEAVHWLNSQTDEGTDFFAVELELIGVDESKLAPYFAVAARPRAKLTREPNAFFEFHMDLLQGLNQARPGFTSRPPLRSFYLTFKEGLPRGYRLATAFQKDAQRVDRFEVELVIEMPERTVNDAAFDRLSEAREAVETEIGERLEWRRVSEHYDLAARVFAYRPGGINSTDDQLEEFKQWAIELLPKFRDTFAPRIAALDLDALTAEAATNEEATL